MTRSQIIPQNIFKSYMQKIKPGNIDDDSNKLDPVQKGTSPLIAYRELFRNQLSATDVHLIERASEYCSPVGGDRFCQQIEARYGIKLGQSARGRPKK